MYGFDIKNFVDNYNFESLTNSFLSGTWSWFLMWEPFWALAAVLIILVTIPKTREKGTKALIYAVVGGVYFVGGVTVKNSTISELGPFLLTLTLVMAIIGYFTWKTLLKAD